MAYTPITPSGGVPIYARFIPQQGDMYSANNGTGVITTDNTTVLSLKCQATSKVVPKITTGNSTQACKARLVNGLWYLQFRNSADTTASNGARFAYTADTTYDPSSRTIFAIIAANRFGKLLADMYVDPGNSLAGSVTQIACNTATGHLGTFNGTSFAADASPFIALGNQPTLVCIRIDGTITPSVGVKFWRYDQYNTSNVLQVVTTGRTITSNATATGFNLGGRAADNLFGSFDCYFWEDWGGEFIDSDIPLQFAQIAAYAYTQLGISLKPQGSEDTLLVAGDSNYGIAASPNLAAGLGGVATAGLVGTYPSLKYYLHAAASRQFSHMTTASLQPIIDALTATTGRGVVLIQCGENDALTRSAAQIYADCGTFATSIKTACPWAKIVWMFPPQRGDSDTSTVIGNLTTLVNGGNPTNVDAVFRTDTDTILGIRSTYTTPNTTYVDGDKVHWKAAAYTRIWSTTDATQTLQTILTAQFAAALPGHGDSAAALDMYGIDGVFVA